MGITVALESETGKTIATVEDETNALHRGLPVSGEEGFPWASTIDLYGDTVFNRLQVPHLRREWDRLVDRARDESVLKMLRAIAELLARCQTEPHLYVRFYGD